MEDAAPTRTRSPDPPVLPVEPSPVLGFCARFAQNTSVVVCTVAVVAVLALLIGSDTWLLRASHSDEMAGPSPIPTRGRAESRWSTVAADPTDAVDIFFKQAGRFRCPQTRLYTKKEIAAHKTANDLWVVIDGNVLDLSMFIAQHPGGALLLEGAGGDDAAGLFAQYHHPTSVSLFPSFCIGRLKKE